MKLRRATTALIVSIALAVPATYIASPPSDAEAGAVDSCGGSCQNIGLRVEEYDWETSWGECYGACGPGCSYVCSWGGACQTHDYYMRKHGLWSWQQFATFPPALVQWGSCVTGRGVEWVGQTIVSKVTGAAKWIGKKVAGIFN